MGFETRNERIARELKKLKKITRRLEVAAWLLLVFVAVTVLLNNN